MNASTLPPENAEPRSAPAQKIFSPAPVTTSARTASSSMNSPSTALSSCTSSPLIAFAGGRLSMTTAKLSSRVTTSVSYAIDGDSSQEHGCHGVRRVAQPVLPLAEHPRRRHLIHRTEQHLGRDLHGDVAPDRARRLPFLEDAADQLEVRGHRVRGRPTKDLVSLPKLDLDDFGESRIVLEHAEVQVDEPPDLRDGVRLGGDLRARVAHPCRHLFAEEADEDLVLRLEIEIGRASW